jgi:hypothetical protein
MKNISLIILLLISQQLWAQEETSTNPNFRLQSAYVSAGISSPELDYWNTTYLLGCGCTDQFSYNMKIGAFFDYYLFKNIITNWGISHWADKVEPDNQDTFQSLTISMTSFTGGLLYGFELFNLDIYSGINGNFFLVQNKFAMLQGTGNLIDKEQGQDYSLELVFGFDKLFPSHLLLGMEFNYTIGSYFQGVHAGDQTNREKVSVQGPYLGLKLGYHFK